MFLQMQARRSTSVLRAESGWSGAAMSDSLKTLLWAALYNLVRVT